MPLDLRRISKFFSYVLRHNPQKFGLDPDQAGWVDVNTLFDRAQENGYDLSLEIIKAVIHTSDKNRFVLSRDEQYIRATYGHSIPVTLEYDPMQPPENLYHGTAKRHLLSIKTGGLQPQNRQYVHLSGNKQSAKSVGQRHGTPVVLTILSGDMAQDGYTFYKSDAKIWLTKQVPPSYIVFPD